MDEQAVKSTNGRAILGGMNTAPLTSKGVAPRELILARPFELAREDGMEGVSSGTGASSAGMSKSGVFAHFGSREQLQLELLDAVAARFLEFVKAPAIREPRGLPRLRKI